MSTKAEIIERALNAVTGIGGDPHQSVFIDGDITVETLFPHAVRYAIYQLIREPENIHDVSRAYPIVITAGVGTLPDSVVKECIGHAIVTGRPFVSWLPYADYQRHRFDAQIDYITFLGSSILYKQATVASFSGTITLNTPGLPDIAVEAGVELDLGLRAVEKTIEIIVAVLRGEISMKELVEENQRRTNAA